MHQSIDNKRKILLYVLFLILLSTVNNKTISVNSNYLFAIDQIHISGLSKNENQTIKEKLRKSISNNILLINKEKIQRLIAQNKSIESFEVRKIYPHNISIKIKKTKFIAQIKNNNHFFIGSNGKLIKRKDSISSLPFFFGKFDSKKFLEFKKIINESAFDLKNINAIFLYPSNRWDVKTIDGTLIKLPDRNQNKALEIAYEIINNNGFKNKRVIDLRITNNIVTSQ